MKGIAILITVAATFLGGFGSLLLKLGAAKFKLNIVALLKNYKLIAGLSLYVLASIMFIVALKYAELSLLYPIIALSYVWAVLLSIKYLNEKMSLNKWVGVAFIILGVALIGFGS